MSKEYIERAAVVAFLENMAASKYLIQCFEDKEKFPAADVEPMRHGEWEFMSDTFVNCSQCGTIFEALPTPYGFSRNNIYCRHCGAKMGGNKPATKNYPRCHKCIYEISCNKLLDNEGLCHSYKRDPKDGGFYG